MSTELRTRREQTGWSLRALAEHAGVSTYTLSMAERGRSHGPRARERIEAALTHAAANPAPKGKPRGFAVMDPAVQAAIASRGGKKAHAIGSAHKFTPEEARAAGRLGGQAHNREHMAELGRRGGEAGKGRRGKEKARTNTATEQPQKSSPQRIDLIAERVRARQGSES